MTFVSHLMTPKGLQTTSNIVSSLTLWSLDLYTLSQKNIR